MAVAGSHNLSVFESSFLRESQSAVSRRWGERDRPSTRASSLLQMWRELEGEHVASHSDVRERPRRLGSDMSTQGSVSGDDISENGIMVENRNGSFCHSVIESENEHEDTNSFCSEQSSDLGDVERERVRRIFREWNSGVKSHSPNALQRDNRSRTQWLGENECGRVRIIREWVQINSQQKGTCSSPRDEGVAEVGSQIDLVRDGQLVNHCEVGERRPIRRLCGRQALLDLLKKAEMERKKELQDLLEFKQVSSFPHRNRIQSLLRGRFLLNRKLIQDERPSSMAASELGSLRQRHTVSDLREGFLSRLDCGSVNGASSSDDLNNHRIEQSQSITDQEVRDEIYNQSVNERIEMNETHSVNNIQGIVDVYQQEYDASVTEAQEQVLGIEERVQEISSAETISEDVHEITRRSLGNQQWQQIIDTDSTLQAHPLCVIYNENDARSTEASHVQEAQVEDGHEITSRSLGNQQLQQILNTDSILQTHPLCVIYNENDAESTEASHVQGAQVDEFTWQDMSAQVEDYQVSLTAHEENNMPQLDHDEISEWTEVNTEDVGEIWQEGTANQWYQEASGNDVEEHNHMQESDEEWHGNVLQDAIDSWLDVPSEQGAISIERVDYYSDEDNIQRMELRELVSRRRVSTLLGSGFRESLDQLIQSYVQRQNHASVDWELDEESLPPASFDQDQELQRDNLDEGQELQNVNWPGHDTQQQVGNEWETINELRFDMGRLQQRMNNMQRMLEACMDMQLELQRSVWQEVSAALHRPINLKDVSVDSLPMDETKWDPVRKGVCCMCSENNIDSLLYRCGHMCTCSKCAEKLVQGGKCPMCLAPVIEVIRAYSIQ